MNERLRSIKRRLKVSTKKGLTKYAILDRWTLDPKHQYEEDDDTRSNDIDGLIKKATEMSEEDGHNHYIVEIKKTVKPIKQPYEVTVQDYES